MSELRAELLLFRKSVGRIAGLHEDELEELVGERDPRRAYARVSRRPGPHRDRTTVPPMGVGAGIPTSRVDAPRTSFIVVAVLVGGAAGMDVLSTGYGFPIQIGGIVLLVVALSAVLHRGLRGQ